MVVAEPYRSGRRPQTDQYVSFHESHRLPAFITPGTKAWPTVKGRVARKRHILLSSRRPFLQQGYFLRPRFNSHVPPLSGFNGPGWTLLSRGSAVLPGSHCHLDTVERCLKGAVFNHRGCLMCTLSHVPPSGHYSWDSVL